MFSFLVVMLSPTKGFYCRPVRGSRRIFMNRWENQVTGSQPRSTRPILRKTAHVLFYNWLNIIRDWKIETLARSNLVNFSLQPTPMPDPYSFYNSIFPFQCTSFDPRNCGFLITLKFNVCPTAHDLFCITLVIYTMKARQGISPSIIIYVFINC